MPTAQRRAKQKVAIAKAKAEAMNASTSQTLQTTSFKSTSTQTEITAHAVRDMIEKWWKWMDSRGIDQSECEMQFIIGMNSRTLAKSTADLEHGDRQARGESRGKDDEQNDNPDDDDDLHAEEYYYDEYCDYYPDSDYIPDDDLDGVGADGAVHGRDNAEPLAVCCGYEPCMVDCGTTSLSASNTPAGLSFIDLEGMD